MGRLIDADEVLVKLWDKKYDDPNDAIEVAKIINASAVEAIPKTEYEARLKADMVAMLTELKNELTDISWNIDMYDSDLDFECCYLSDIDKVIQQKIDKLKGEQND